MFMILHIPTDIHQSQRVSSKLVPAIQCPYCMYIYLYFVSNVTKPKHQAASKLPNVHWGEACLRNMLTPTWWKMRGISCTIQASWERPSKLRGGTKKEEMLFSFTLTILNMCNCVMKNPSIYVKIIVHVLRLFTGRVANARTAYYSVAGSMLPAFMGRYNRPSTIVWTLISIQNLMSFRLQHAQMSD